MLPDISNPKWGSLLKGEINHNFSSVPASLITSRLRREIQKNSSEENLKKCVTELYNFLKKYETVFTNDINEIFK